MEQALIEALNKIAYQLECVGVAVALVFIAQILTLLFKDNNGGYYLRQINETLKNITKR